MLLKSVELQKVRKFVILKANVVVTTDTIGIWKPLVTQMSDVAMEEYSNQETRRIKTAVDSERMTED